MDLRSTACQHLNKTSILGYTEAPEHLWGKAWPCLLLTALLPQENWLAQLLFLPACHLKIVICLSVSGILSRNPLPGFESPP